MVMLILINYLVGWFSMCSCCIEMLVEGELVLIVCDGKLLVLVLKWELVI